MLLLPNELVFLLCSLLTTKDLRALTQLSSRLRSLTTPLFLARYNISESDVESGILNLRSRSFFLILVVTHIHPVQKLIFVDWFHHRPPVTEIRQAGRELAAILSATEIIPTISIENIPYFHDNRGILHLLALIPQTATRTFVMIKGDSICLSHPRKTRPIQWESTPPLSLKFSPTEYPILNYLIGVIPLIFLHLISCVRNCRVVLAWVFLRFFGPAWGTENSLSLHTVGDTIVAQTVKSIPARTIGPVPGLGDNQLSSLVSEIDLNPIRSIWIGAKANILHSDLLLFLNHHPNLKALGLQLDSIRPSSLRMTTTNKFAPSSIVSLSAPASYIPPILPVTPHLTSILIDFHPIRSHLASQRVTFSVSAYKRALESVASLPGTHALSLSLAFPADASTLPWVNMPDEQSSLEEASMPERRLSRVQDLLVAGNLTGTAGFGAETLCALPRWLRLFPALRRVYVLPGSRQRAISASEKQALVEAIRAGTRKDGIDQTLAAEISSLPIVQPDSARNSNALGPNLRPDNREQKTLVESSFIVANMPGDILAVWISEALAMVKLTEPGTNTGTGVLT
ncbi:hypothetical protein B0H19DRAFT_1243598 [Mycena capillaripes]|nr:hypothetical protein B0H19DRAFT_1243598 [Mycena capillaripes]